jgi:tRNA (guanine26-N2/guanine27-N2)-dimethyltransferase
LVGHIALNCFRYDYGIVPVFCYWHKHHVRAIVRVIKRNSLIKQNIENLENGIWTGKLFDKELIKKILENEAFYMRDTKKIFEIASQELDIYLFWDLNYIGRMFRISTPSVHDVIEKLHSLGYNASRTIFSPTGIKTDAPFDVLAKIIKETSK